MAQSAIISKQNEPRLINYLKAQRIAYTQCKSFQILDTVSILIAIVLPAIGLINDELIKYFGAFGVVWTIIYLIAENYRKRKSGIGAKIQEEFDTDLFRLPWNKVLCGSKVNHDIKASLAEKYVKDDLHNWYSLEIGTDLPHNLAIILCQRINFSWELTLRKKFVRLLVSALVLYYGIFIITAIFLNLGWYDLLILLAPSIPFMVFGVLNGLALRAQVKSKNNMLDLIDSHVDNYGRNGEVPDEPTLRQIQDVVYAQRTVPEKIPDWFYRMHQESSEDKIGRIIREIKEKL